MQDVPSALCNQGYQFISLGVTSLITNVPLNRTMKLILKTHLQ